MNLQDIVAVYPDHMPRFSRITSQRIRDLQMATYAPLSLDQLDHLIVIPGYVAVHQDLRDGGAEHITNLYSVLGTKRAEQNGMIGDVMQALQIATSTLVTYVDETLKPGAATMYLLCERVNALLFAAAHAFAQSFVAGRENIIHQQALQLREISTPIIPIHKGILVLPLVGALDSQRAAQVMDELLAGVERLRASVVLMDVTGVPVVDTAVANHLLQVARAARLLGAQVIMVGIKPEIAQTIVQLGVDLSDITTQANLQTGVEYALALRGQTIVAVERAGHMHGRAAPAPTSGP